MSDAAETDRVTLAQLAELAGVSLSTVSKVLNGRTDVSAATRAKVEALLEAHGYRRRGAGEPRSELIELVFPELQSVWSMEIIGGVEAVARTHGLSVVLTESGDRHAPAEDWVDGVLRRRPVGVVLVFSDLPPAMKRKLRSRAIPFAIVDPAGDPAPDVPSVGSANWSGGLMATRHLIELGHRRIGMISGPDDMMCSLARIDGYRSAMGTAGLPLDDALVRYGDFEVDGGRTGAAALLDLADPPTAIFAGSDLQALGVLETAYARGIRVPEQLSVVGYDDIPAARWVTPALTTVHQPLRRMGASAAELVIQLAAAETPEQPTPRMDLATHVVVRQSTAAPAA
ncbi:LacI family DNA-binding transcriptional regulator [Agromyces seonyuensis]|uniref:LacI family DNA-binding transcriptional regulator n=1 Tax=Agromyces seonyuensis TaxID=2662446 RepID=A0A6I4NU67_9MICO|nr:LacI family DNA-binding transcriptional regulator [Agromyces seonyuensis]MWB97641.1 LacI family DNA-binding transcriptional regulator [Agromyces seonyuensis]